MKKEYKRTVSCSPIIEIKELETKNIENMEFVIREIHAHMKN